MPANMGPFLAARTMNPSVNFPKTKLNGSVQLLVRQHTDTEARVRRTDPS
jgi:hypothetical protein